MVRKDVKSSYLFWLIFGVVVAVGLLVGSLYLYVSSLKTETPAPSSQAAVKKDLPPPDFESFKVSGDKLDYSWAAKTLVGEAVPMSQFQNKVLFLHFWASWCLPCHREMPLIQTAYDKLKDKVAFVLISNESVETINKFLSKRTFSFPLYKIDGARPGKFKSLGNPATIIIDKEGKIVFIHSGAADWAHEKSLEFLSGLLKEQTSETQDQKSAPNG